MRHNYLMLFFLAVVNHIVYSQNVCSLNPVTKKKEPLEIINFTVVNSNHVSFTGRIDFQFEILKKNRKKLRYNYPLSYNDLFCTLIPLDTIYCDVLHVWDPNWDSVWPAGPQIKNTTQKYTGQINTPTLLTPEREYVLRLYFYPYESDQRTNKAPYWIASKEIIIKVENLVGEDSSAFQSASNSGIGPYFKELGAWTRDVYAMDKIGYSNSKTRLYEFISQFPNSSLSKYCKFHILKLCSNGYTDCSKDELTNVIGFADEIIQSGDLKLKFEAEIYRHLSLEKLKK